MYSQKGMDLLSWLSHDMNKNKLCTNYKLTCYTAVSRVLNCVLHVEITGAQCKQHQEQLAHKNLAFLCQSHYIIL